VLIFSLALVFVEFFLQFCDFSPNKSCKTDLRPMLPPGSRNLQLISVHSMMIALVMGALATET
jgi:hypothetical protein